MPGPQAEVKTYSCYFFRARPLTPDLTLLETPQTSLNRAPSSREEHGRHTATLHLEEMNLTIIYGFY
jgi:hypothetical protein